MRRMVGYDWFKTRKMCMCIVYGPTCKPMNYSSVSLYSAISVKYTESPILVFILVIYFISNCSLCTWGICFL